MKIFGILNITIDSFSDGGKFLTKSEAIKHAQKLLSDGADILDISGQSSNIHSENVPIKTEWERLSYLLDTTDDLSSISVDSYKPEIIHSCIERKVGFINNINGFDNPQSIEVLKNFKDTLPRIICMFNPNSDKAKPTSDLTKENVMDKIVEYFETKLESLAKAGVPHEKLILDPGMGLFLSPDPMVSIEVLRNIQKLRMVFGLKILVSVSRKSFIGKLCNEENPNSRLGGSLACELYLASQGVDYIRTHDVYNLRQALNMRSFL